MCRENRVENSIEDPGYKVRSDEEHQWKLAEWLWCHEKGRETKSVWVTKEKNDHLTSPSFEMTKDIFLSLASFTTSNR